VDHENLKRSELAKVLGVTARTVTNWFKRGCPRNNDGTYRIRDVFDWAIEETKKAVAPTEEPDEAQRWLTEFRKERAKITALERKQREGSLIPIKEVERAFTARCYEFSRTLLLMPRRISHRLAAKSKKRLREVEAILDDEVRQYLASYSRPIETEDGS